MSDKILNRELTKNEKELIIWMIYNGSVGSRIYINQVEKLRVISYCKCGCASINFLDSSNGFNIISDYLYKDENDKESGIFLFETNKKLAGLEVYSLEADYVPSKLPKSGQLYPFET